MSARDPRLGDEWNWNVPAVRPTGRSATPYAKVGPTRVGKSADTRHGVGTPNTWNAFRSNVSRSRGDHDDAIAREDDGFLQLTYGDTGDSLRMLVASATAADPACRSTPPRTSPPETANRSPAPASPTRVSCR
jgi:hypothetical protein